MATAGINRRDPLLGSNRHRWETPGRTHSNSNGSQHLNGEEIRDETGRLTGLNRDQVVPKGKAGWGLRSLGSTDNKQKRFATSSLTAFTGGLRARMHGNGPGEQRGIKRNAVLTGHLVRNTTESHRLEGSG